MAERKMKSKTRRENLIMMIISAVIAMIAWVILSITTFSEITVTLRDVPIDFSLEGTYADLAGLSVVDRDIEQVNVSFVGQRDSVGKYTGDDIRVTLDLNSVRTSGAYDIPLVVTSVNGDQLENIEIAPQRTVHVEFDRYSSKVLSVANGTLRVNSEGISAAEGYLIDPNEIEITPSEITISGPQDYIDQVTSCEVGFDRSMTLRESNSLSTSAITLYSSEAVFENPRVSVDTDLFNVYIPVYITKTLPIEFTIQSYSDNIDASSVDYSLSVDEITVRSQNSDIDKISGINLGVLDIRSIYPGAVMNYGITPSSYYENISGVYYVTITFDLEGYARRDITLTNSQIHVINAPSDYEATVQTDRLNVTVVGPEELLDTLDSSNFVAEVNLLDYNVSPGSRQFNATVYSPGHPNIWALNLNPVYATIAPAESDSENSNEG